MEFLPKLHTGYSALCWSGQLCSFRASTVAENCSNSLYYLFCLAQSPQLGAVRRENRKCFRNELCWSRVSWGRLSTKGWHSVRILYENAQGCLNTKENREESYWLWVVGPKKGNSASLFIWIWPKSFTIHTVSSLRATKAYVLKLTVGLTEARRDLQISCTKNTNHRCTYTHS